MHAISFRLARLLFWLALTLYLGGLIALGAVAAPQIFKTLQSTYTPSTQPAATSPQFPITNSQLPSSAPDTFPATTTASTPSPATPPTTSQILWNSPRQLGGEIFGNVLGSFAYLEVAALAAMIASLVIESLLFRAAMLRKPLHLLRILLVLTAAAFLVYDVAILWPQILSTRTAWRNSGLSETSPAKTEFDALHKSSESLAHAKVYTLLALLALTALASTPLPPRQTNNAKPRASQPPI